MLYATTLYLTTALGIKLLTHIFHLYLKYQYLIFYEWFVFNLRLVFPYRYHKIYTCKCGILYLL